MNIRKFLGFKPRVGDQIAAGMDFGVHFKGTVIEDNSSNEALPHYICKGVTTIYTHWNGVVEKESDREIVPAGRARIA